MATHPTAVRMPRNPLPPNSVFALAGGQASATGPVDAPKPAVKRGGGRGPSELPDLATVAVRSGVPLPPVQHGSSSSVYRDLYERMKKDDMVELTTRQAKSFHAWAKSKKRGLAVRILGPGRHGCWRIE